MLLLWGLNLQKILTSLYTFFSCVIFRYLSGEGPGQGVNEGLHCSVAQMEFGTNDFVLLKRSKIILNSEPITVSKIGGLNFHLLSPCPIFQYQVPPPHSTPKPCILLFLPKFWNNSPSPHLNPAWKTPLTTLLSPIIHVATCPGNHPASSWESWLRSEWVGGA